MPDADPSHEELRTLHGTLVAGDPTAPARLATVLLPALRRRFAGFRGLDRAEVDSQIGLCIARYLQGPERYDTDRGPLLPYLYRDVQGDLYNEMDKRRRRPEKPSEPETLELDAHRGNLTTEDEVVDRLDPFDRPAELVAAARSELGAMSEEDKEFLRLRAAGVRSTQAYAQVLGVAHLPVDQQRRVVKRAKDRLDKRLAAIRMRLGENVKEAGQR